jgi:hypothetical protein
MTCNCQKNMSCANLTSLVSEPGRTAHTCTVTFRVSYTTRLGTASIVMTACFPMTL